MAEIINFPDINTKKTKGVWNEVKYLFGSKEQRTRRHGLEAERKVASLLGRGLPDEFLVVNNYPLASNGHHQDIDHLVIGPTGVFCIDTKSSTGDISVTGNGFERIKTDNWGNRFLKDAKRPDRQVKNQIRLLKEKLQPYGLHRDWIHPLLCFTHASVDASEAGVVEITSLSALIPAILRKRLRARPVKKEPYKRFFLSELQRVL